MTGASRRPTWLPGRTPFFKLCYKCGHSMGVRLTPCTRCYGILTCSAYCETKAWSDFHRRDCHSLMAIGESGRRAGLLLGHRHRPAGWPGKHPPSSSEIAQIQATLQNSQMDLCGDREATVPV